MGCTSLVFDFVQWATANRFQALSVKYKILIERLRGIIEHTKVHLDDLYLKWLLIVAVESCSLPRSFEANSDSLFAFSRSHPHGASFPFFVFSPWVLTNHILGYSITFTSDGNPSTRPSNSAPDLMLINYDKFAKLGKIAIEFRRYQEVCAFSVSDLRATYWHGYNCSRSTSTSLRLYKRSCILCLQREGVVLSMLYTARAVSRPFLFFFFSPKA